MSLTYLASPYSAATDEQKKNNYTIVCQKAAQLMASGEAVFCPIAHSVAVEKDGALGVKDGHFWLIQDFAILAKCDKLKVYKMPGWDKSYGVFAEIAFANHLGIHVEYIDYEEVKPMDEYDKEGNRIW